MKVLVTGAAGAVGRHVVAEFRTHGAVVIGLDRVTPAAAWLSGGGPTVFAVAEATDESAVRSSVAGCDAVVHLAAIPAPTLAPPLEVFAGNTQATMTVLTAAAEAGARSAIIASSISILGLVYAQSDRSPDYVPIDEDHPLRVEDPYALSKQCDEATGRMIATRYGLPVAALRLPYTASAEAIAERSRSLSSDPAPAARELWAYLDARDAALACRLAVAAQLAGSLRGFTCLNIVAEDSIVDEPLTELLGHYHPRTVIRGPAGSSGSAYDTRRSRAALGFVAPHLRRPEADRPAQESV
jgi:nucleoside-diphosphate-sugar epimerase